MSTHLLPWTVFLAFVAGAFLFDWEQLPPYTSLAVAIVIVAAVLVFDKPDRRDRW